MSIADVTAVEFTALVRNAGAFKQMVKAGEAPVALSRSLAGKTVAMTFSKRSTRTRVSTEAAVALMGGHPMFLGRDDIQLGVSAPCTAAGSAGRCQSRTGLTMATKVNESLRDTSIIISSMVACMVARVGPHSDVVGLAEYSSVPVLNALSDRAHPLQTIADFLTIHEAFPHAESTATGSLGLEGLKVAWVGDANNVLFDLATACLKLGLHIAVAAPKGYGIPPVVRQEIISAGVDASTRGELSETHIPEEAIKGADIIVTDTWVSMGQEAEVQQRLKAFQGFQITNDLVARGGAQPGWKFMHCLPRHPEEVADDVFYGPRSLVFPEGENRLWAATCKHRAQPALPAFVASLIG
jgi:ornithine carbamoyltransferase